MPVYEYKCINCAATLEVKQGIKEPALVYCEECKKDTLERLISRTSFALKGSGWYQTDYKNK